MNLAALLASRLRLLAIAARVFILVGRGCVRRIGRAGTIIVAATMSWTCVADSAGCPLVSVGIDTSRANLSGDVILGEALGQTFLAADTLVHSITVWRVAVQPANDFGMHLYVTETDELGRPIRTAIVQNGPTLVNTSGDGIHHVKFEFVFEPPLALPHRGTYFFAVQASPCYGFFDVPSDSLNEYADGRMYSTGRSECGYLGSIRPLRPNTDMIFTVTFCDQQTPTVHGTWGRVKVLYR